MTESGVGYVETYHPAGVEVQIESIGERCAYRPLPTDANSSAISDLEFVAAIGAVLEEHPWATIYDLQNILGVRESLIRAKARRTYRRGLTVGCICGCRGDFRLTTAGHALFEGEER